MIRTKLVVGFTFLILCQVGFAVYALQATILPMTTEDADITLQRSTSLIEKSHRLDEFSLKAKAEHVADRTELRNAMVRDYDGDWEAQRHREVHKQLETEHIRFSEFMAEDNQGERNLDLSLMDRRPLDHDMFMALDDSGRLVATLGAGLAHLMGDDVGRQFSVVFDAMDDDETRIDMWNWSWRAADDREFYVVAISPIYHPDGTEPVGTVVLGNRVTDAIAERRRALVSDGLGEDAQRQFSERERTQAPEITFFRGDRIYSSTFSSSPRSDLQRQLFDHHQILDNEEPQEILDTTIGGRHHRSMVRFFPGQFETDNPAGVVLTTNRDDAIAPIEAVRSNLLLVGGIVLAVGIIFIVGVVHLFLVPFGRLEEGIQEILSGDKDHSFETDRDHDVADNLAHHLNLLSAFLQGKPMPDEEQSMGGWDGFDDDAAESDSENETSVAGVPMDMGGGATSDEDEDDEQPDDSDKTRQRDDEPAGEPT